NVCLTAPVLISGYETKTRTGIILSLSLCDNRRIITGGRGHRRHCSEGRRHIEKAKDRNIVNKEKVRKGKRRSLPSVWAT
ncbi:MAG: hypothetical protein ACKPKO_12550, partial [Candidatus Fonsibacter sp.]